MNERKNIKTYNCIKCIFQFECAVAYYNPENKCSDYTKENTVCISCLTKRRCVEYQSPGLIYCPDKVTKNVILPEDKEIEKNVLKLSKQLAEEQVDDTLNKMGIIRRLIEKYVLLNIEEAIEAWNTRQPLKTKLPTPTNLEYINVDYSLDDEEKEEPFCVECGQYLDRSWKVCPVCCIEIDWSKENKE